MADPGRTRWLLIAPIAWGRERPGGIETFTRELARRLADAGDRVTVLCGSTAGVLEGPIRLVEGGEGRTPSELGFLIRIAVRFAFLRRSLRSHDVAVVNVEHLVPVGRAFAKRVVLVSHGPTAAALAARRGRWLAVPYRGLVERLAIAAAFRLLAITHSSFEYFRGRYPGASWRFRRLFLPTTGVLSEREAASTRSDEHALCFVGRLSPEKQVDLAIRAWVRVRAQDPKARLLIVGSGPEESRLRRLRDELQVNGVEFLGTLSRREVGERLSRSRGLLLVSEREVFPSAVPEALARGKPVITTRVGETLSLIDDSTGIVVEPTPDSVSDAALRILRSTDDEMRKYAVSAVNRVRRLGWEGFLTEFRAAVEHANEEGDA